MAIDLDDPTTWPVGIYECTTEERPELGGPCEGYGEAYEMRVPEDPMTHRVICGLCGVEITKKART